MYFIGLILSYYSGVMFPGKFMQMFAMGAIPSIIQILLMLFTMSEPPVYLARNGNMINADKQLRTFYSFIPNNSG